MIRVFAFVVALTACGGSAFVTGPGPARARIDQLTHVMQREPNDAPTVETIRVVTVTNPTGEAVIVDCSDLRVPVAAHREEAFALHEDEGACDLQPASTYSPNTTTGNVLPVVTTGVPATPAWLSRRPPRHLRNRP